MRKKRGDDPEKVSSGAIEAHQWRMESENGEGIEEGIQKYIISQQDKRKKVQTGQNRPKIAAGNNPT